MNASRKWVYTFSSLFSSTECAGLLLVGVSFPRLSVSPRVHLWSPAYGEGEFQTEPGAKCRVPIVHSIGGNEVLSPWPPSPIQKPRAGYSRPVNYRNGPPRTGNRSAGLTVLDLYFGSTDCALVTPLHSTEGPGSAYLIDLVGIHRLCVCYLGWKTKIIPEGATESVRAAEAGVYVRM